jgi:signal transduction histidine kinase
MASVGEFIRQHQQEIVTRWSAEVQSAASARGLTAPKLTNIMPEFLASLSEDGEPASADRRRVSVLGHLAARIRQGFDLGEVLSEFHVLERCIVRMWVDLAEPDKPTHADIERLRERVQDATFQVTDEFFHHMLEEEQSEKRYQRLLQDIASEALHDDRRPLPDRLRDVLDVIGEAMSAYGAAVVLFSRGADQQVTLACNGGEVFAAYMQSIADRDSTDPPFSSIDDGEAHAIEVPGPMRPGGVESLLAAPLPRQAELHGVLYVAIADSCEITPRDLHRLEVLAERLGLHLENARLFGELRETIASLRVERGLRERFVATLAHDLRGPLSAARLAAELIAREPARTLDLTLRIERNIARVDRMIRDMLDANRIRAGEPLPLRLDVCDLCALAHQVAEEARAMYGDRFVVDCAVVRGIWSADELQRALWNLVSNAVKYGVQKQPITISVTASAGGAQASVHNVGEPLPAEELRSLFEPFYRSAKASAGGNVGWGLGLTLVRGCAEAHGGHATVSSDQTGTTFSIELPLDATPYQRGATPSFVTAVH